MKSGEEREVCDLVIRVFNEFVAAQYSQEGVQEFLKYVEPDELKNRCQTNDFVLIAKTQDRIVGMIEIVDHKHISLFYTDKQFQGRGIGKELLKKSLELCFEHNPELSEISVNSSPNAVTAYQESRFSAVSPNRQKMVSALSR